MNTESQSITSRSSGRASTSNAYELDCSFQPYPPIKDQENNLRTSCQKIIKCLPEIRNEDVELDDEINDFVEKASDFQTALQKYLADLIKTFTSIFRRKNRPYSEVQRACENINEAIEQTLVNDIFDAFRKKQESIVLTYLEKPSFLNLLVEFWGFVEDCAIILINQVWEYCTEIDRYIYEYFNETHSENTLYSTASSLFIDILKKHYDVLGELQLKFINGVKQIDLAKYYDPEEEEEEEMNENIMSQKEEKQLRKKIGNAIRRSFMLIYPNIKEYWDIEFSAKLNDLIDKKNQQEEEEYYEEENEDDGIVLDIEIYDLFDVRLQQIETLYQIARRITGDDQKRLKKFILSEASQSFDNQLECLKELWLHSSRAADNLVYCEGEMAHIGHKIFDNLRVQLHHYDDLQMKPAETLTRACEIFKISEEIQDSNTTDQIICLVFNELQDQLEILKNEFQVELDNFKGPPDPKYITIFQNNSKKRGTNINSIAMNLADSIKLIDNAYFYHSKFDPSILTKETELSKNLDVFQAKPLQDQFAELSMMSGVLERTLLGHIKSLKKKLDSAYNTLYSNDPSNRSTSQSLSLSTISGQTGRSDTLKTQDKRLINDKLSMCSRTSKNVSLKSKTGKPPKQKVEFRSLIEMILESLCRTYEELFAVYRNMIIQTTRFTTSDDTPIMTNEKLNQNFTKYLSYLDILKKWYIEEMNVDKVQVIEKRMDVCHNLSQNIINECLEESFRDCVENAILKYLQGCTMIEDSQNKDLEELDDSLLHKLEGIRDKRHTKELQIIELQYRIALVNEKKRTSKAQSEIEDRVRSLLAAKQYDQAKKEQEKIPKVKREEWKLKKKQIDDKYKKIREQKLEQQAASIKVLEDWYENQKMLINKKYQQLFTENQNILKAVQIQAIQQHLNMSNLMKKGTNVKKAEEQQKKMAGSPMKKRQDTLTRRYTEIANSILRDYNIDLKL